MLLDVQDVEKRFGGVRALGSGSLSVRRGEMHGLIGPNGSGKRAKQDAGTAAHLRTAQVPLD